MRWATVQKRRGHREGGTAQSAESPKRVTLEWRDKGLSFVGAVEVFQAHRTDTAWLPKVLGPGRGRCGWSRGREGGGGR